MIYHGCVRGWTDKREREQVGSDEVLRSYMPGDFFGELALLTGGMLVLCRVTPCSSCACHTMLVLCRVRCLVFCVRRHVRHTPPLWLHVLTHTSLVCTHHLLWCVCLVFACLPLLLPPVMSIHTHVHTHAPVSVKCGWLQWHIECRMLAYNKLCSSMLAYSMRVSLHTMSCL